MKKLNILKTIEPKKERYQSPYSLSVVTVQDPDTGATWDAYYNRDSYKIFLLEQELLSKGVDGKLLEEYKSLVHSEAIFDHTCPECGNGPN